jgi:UDPglucose 6-dehydrogenase/UDP-N-acetyl-D-galactosamine dehydrogenase
MTHRPKDKTVCIAGLGYVGLPLALAFSGHLPTIGFDVDAGKILELFLANDNPGIAFTDDPGAIKNADFVIIAVPTPVTKLKDPDLSHIESAARTIGRNLKRGCNRDTRIHSLPGHNIRGPETRVRAYLRHRLQDRLFP